MFDQSPPLTTVCQQLQQLIQGKLLIGHGLIKDLAALGASHPPSLCFDTMNHPAFASKSGSARSLKYLAEKHLGLQIQQPRSRRRGRKGNRAGVAEVTGRSDARRQQQQEQLGKGQEQSSGGVYEGYTGHDPLEDAAAVMLLYQQVVRPQTYEGLVEQQTAQLLEDMRRFQQQQQQEQPQVVRIKKNYKR
jgi:hypothetical protein